MGPVEGKTILCGLCSNPLPLYLLPDNLPQIGRRCPHLRRKLMIRQISDFSWAKQRENSWNKSPGLPGLREAHMSLVSAPYHPYSLLQAGYS